jgi:magnesium chelatase family protein
VRGQEGVKRALEVAAAGGHNALLVGPPGAGKTMLARRLPGILPPLTPDEALETTKIHSVGGKLDGAARHGLVTQRPFRSPHHTISDAGLCGGGTHPMPGEISLAHTASSSSTSSRSSVGRCWRSCASRWRRADHDSAGAPDGGLPAQFMLLASMNPCPCGHLNDPTRACVCAPPQVQRYLPSSRVRSSTGSTCTWRSPRCPYAGAPPESLGSRARTVRQRVIVARERQAERFRRLPGVHANAQMPPRLVRSTPRWTRRGRACSGRR